MAFQTAVAFGQGYGIPGELYDSSPHRAMSSVLNTTDPTNNVFGRVATYIAGVDEQVTMGGTGAFAGFLVNPKNHVTPGVGGNAFSPTLTLPNGETASFLTMGRIFVVLPASAAIGDYVFYNNTTGVLTTLAPGTTPVTGTTFANAIVTRFNVVYPDAGAVPGLAVIEVTQMTTNP